MRGEYRTTYCNTHHTMELPPRARRILKATIQWCKTNGTTSACAENTTLILPDKGYFRNYLRVRGEYNSGPDRLFLNKELPPRARRIRPVVHNHDGVAGTTSACAENTHNCFAPPNAFRNYLRVRGEYTSQLIKATNAKELPPRARRILPNGRPHVCYTGTTSACAENTPTTIT